PLTHKHRAGASKVLICSRPNGSCAREAQVRACCFFLALLASAFKPSSRLEAENAALRYQLMVLQRKLRGRIHFTNSDRLFFVQLYRWFPSVLRAMIIIGQRPWCADIALGSSLLALEIPPRGRPAANRRGIAGVDLADER